MVQAPFTDREKAQAAGRLGGLGRQAQIAERKAQAEAIRNAVPAEAREALIALLVRDGGLPNPDDVRRIVNGASLEALGNALNAMRAASASDATKPETQLAIVKTAAGMLGFLKPDDATMPAQYEDRLAEEYRRAGVEL